MRAEDDDSMEARMDAIRIKHLLDPDSLTEQELMCIQIEENGGGCASCARTRAGAV